jgi:hypothetical protein
MEKKNEKKNIYNDKIEIIKTYIYIIKIQRN